VFNVTLNTPGSQTITVTDTTAATPTITGTSGAVTTRGLTVVPDSFTPTPTGFTVSFSKPFVPANLTLYGSNLTTTQDVVMFGQVGARTLASTGGATESGNTVTITASTSTVFSGAFAVGNLIYVSGVSVAGYNGVFTILSRSGNKITYKAPVAGLAAGSGGTASPNLIKGSLLTNSTNTSITFNATQALLVATNAGATAALPDSTYAVTLISGATNGF